MARPIWTGSISFGLVSVPVGLYSATHEHEVSFHQFEKGTADRIRLRRVNERTGKDVEYDDIVKGTDVGDGELVMLDQEELDSVAPGRSRSLEIHQFVDLDEIDPLYYQKTYYLAPGSDETMKTYALLRDAMADANRAAVGTLVMRGKEYLAAIRPDDDLLVLQTMYFADEVRDPKKELDRVPGASKAKPAELSMAAQLIDSMSGPWKPAEYRDTYTDRVNELIEAKKSGREVTVAEDAPEPTNVTDLLEVLRRSVEAAKSRQSAPAKKAPAKKTAAKKTAAKKTATTAKRAAPARKTATKKAAPAKKTAAKKTAAAKNTTARKRAS
ncbi:Ku protein [Couchioplanes caeruleus]|uniref:non-homologous end joining protein Ku n=1 Tax=Couchioplanes caeruleus TaxID=56438 RepID=UPI00201BFE98|nr:Ku protein [Couchioplanes caeruleus]UQU62138.1 Ku protein [Couchioplanes caeruleus]